MNPTNPENCGSLLMPDSAVIVGGARTPFCEWLGGKRGDGGPGGRLASISAEELGTFAIRGQWRVLVRTLAPSIMW